MNPISTLIVASKNLLNYANNYSDAMAGMGYGAEQLGSNADSASVAGRMQAAIEQMEHIKEIDMSAHTEGEWKLDGKERVFFPQGVHANSNPAEDYWDAIRITDSHGDLVGLACGMLDDLPNAHLIAAAPDLLAACEAFRSAFEEARDNVLHCRYQLAELLDGQPEIVNAVLGILDDAFSAVMETSQAAITKAKPVPQP